MMRPEIAQEQYCYLTTRGRRTGNPHTIEIWFGLVGSTLYILAGNGEMADFVRNLRVEPEVQVRIDGVTYPAQARVVTDNAEDARAADAGGQVSARLWQRPDKLGANSPARGARPAARGLTRLEIVDTQVRKSIDF